MLTESHRSMFAGLISDDCVRVLENTSEDVGTGVPLAAADEQGEGEELRLLFLSNLFPEKGCLDLIDALDGLGGRARGISLRLIGEAEPAVAAEVARRAAVLGQRGVKVEYGGTRTGEAKFAEYRSADAFVLPSRYPPEGQPLVLLEAMSAGLAIVASDHSGIPWTVREGIEGLIVRAGDAEALGEAVMRLREDPALRQELGANARRRYEEIYANEAFYRALGELTTEA